MDGFIALLKAGGWVPFAAWLVGALVRLTKDDNKFPINVDPKVRPWIALGLGLVLGILEKFLAGSSWQGAIVGGLTAGAMAIVGHVLGIELLNNGKELPVPFLMKKDGDK